MDREQAQDLFSAYLEGELPPEQVKAFEGLLAADDETRTEYERFCRALDSLALLRDRPLEAPDNFVEKLQSRIRRRSGGKLFADRRLGGLSRVPYEFFSLVLILILLSFYLLTLPVLRLAASAAGPPPEGGQPGEQGER